MHYHHHYNYTYHYHYYYYYYYYYYYCCCHYYYYYWGDEKGCTEVDRCSEVEKGGKVRVMGAKRKG